jgi:Fe-S-cluster containining protein
VEKQTIKSLDLLKCNNSGLELLLDESKSELDYKRFFELLISRKHQELNLEFKNHPDWINTSKIKALFLMNLILQEINLKPSHISMRPAQEFVLDNLAYELIEIYKNIKKHIKLQEVDFYQYLDVMPSMVIYYSDYLLKNFCWDNRENTSLSNQVLERVWGFLANDNYWTFINQDLNSQRYRLMAIYHRRFRNNNLAEASLVQYRECFKPDLQAKIKINSIDITQRFLPNNVLDNIEKIYAEISMIQDEILVRSGVHPDSCFYFSCNDCCTKDFPTVSLVEFLYIKNWFEENNIDMKPFIDNALKVQKHHQEVFGEPLKIVDQVISKSQEENPFSLQFRCPFLSEDNVCQVHPVRPLVCRSFGLSTINNSSVQACKYFLTQYQYNSSHRNERDVFNAVTTTHMFGEANELLAQEHKFSEMNQPVGTLVAWLCYLSS